jgi:hypothetical protein
LVAFFRLDLWESRKEYYDLLLLDNAKQQICHYYYRSSFISTYCTRGEVGLDTLLIDRGLRHQPQVHAVNNSGTIDD